MAPGGDPPDPWRSCPRVSVGEAELARPGPVLDVLHRRWLERRPVVVELGVDPDTPAGPRALRRAGLRARPRVRVRAGAAPLPGVGQQLRRPGRRARSGGTAAKAARRCGAGAWPRAARPTSPWPTARPCSSTAVPRTRRPSPPGSGVVHRWNAEAGRLEPAAHGQPEAELAPDQLAAVGHGSGAARVIAPAGSGKTRVLTERLRHLVADRGAHPGTVSALAYNTRAADEMKQRCSGILTADGPHIRTLNSTGLWICSEFGPAGRPRVLEELEVRDLLQGLFEIRRQANADTVAPYIAALSAVRLGLTPTGRRSRSRCPTRRASPRASTATGRPWPSSAPSTSTSRSTGPSRSWSPTPRPGRRPRPGAAACWSTSSRT